MQPLGAASTERVKSLLLVHSSLETCTRRKFRDSGRCDFQLLASARPAAAKLAYSAGVAQPCRDPVDADVDATFDLLSVAAGAVAPDQLHLQVVQRVDVGESVRDGARQRPIAGQPLLGAGDQR